MGSRCLASSMRTAVHRAPSARGHVAPEDNPVSDSLPELLTVNDFLQRFRIGRTSFYREVNKGSLRILKFGTATRIARVDAQAWVNSLPASPAPGR